MTPTHTHAEECTTFLCYACLGKEKLLCCVCYKEKAGAHVCGKCKGRVHGPIVGCSTKDAGAPEGAGGLTCKRCAPPPDKSSSSSSSEAEKKKEVKGKQKEKEEDSEEEGGEEEEEEDSEEEEEEEEEGEEEEEEEGRRKEGRRTALR